MSQFKAMLKETVPVNRLLSVVGAVDIIEVMLTEAGSTPDFHSTKAFEAGSVVDVTIGNASIWNIEAGEDLKVGTSVQAGKGGVLVASEGKGIGFIAETVKAGEVVPVIRRSSNDGSGQEGPKGAKGPKGDPGEVTTKELNAAMDGLRKEFNAKLEG